MAVEVISGLWQGPNGEDRVFFLLATIEENLELAGVAVVVVALVAEAGRAGIRAQLGFAPQPEGATSGSSRP